MKSDFKPYFYDQTFCIVSPSQVISQGITIIGARIVLYSLAN